MFAMSGKYETTHMMKMEPLLFIIIHIIACTAGVISTVARYLITNLQMVRRTLAEYIAMGK